jgi:hypothetical protein
MLARLANWMRSCATPEAFDFGLVNATLFNFCTNGLSAFYFDIRKDALYCDPKDSARRRIARLPTKLPPYRDLVRAHSLHHGRPGPPASWIDVHLNDFFRLPGVGDPGLIADGAVFVDAGLLPVRSNGVRRRKLVPVLKPRLLCDEGDGPGEDIASRNRHHLLGQSKASLA